MGGGIGGGDLQFKSGDASYAIELLFKIQTSSMICHASKSEGGCSTPFKEIQGWRH